MTIATDKSQDPLDAADRAFERYARELLRESVDRLPARTRSRLTRARHAALAQRPSWASALARRWVPAGAGALAAATLAVLLLVRPHGEAPAIGPLANASPEDLALLADADAVQLGRDGDVDYDFYEWAVSEAKDPGGSSVGT